MNKELFLNVVVCVLAVLMPVVFSFVLKVNLRLTSLEKDMMPDNVINEKLNKITDKIHTLEFEIGTLKKTQKH